MVRDLVYIFVNLDTKGFHFDKICLIHFNVFSYFHNFISE